MDTQNLVLLHRSTAIGIDQSFVVTLERLGKRTPAAADSRSPFLPPIVADLAGVSKRNEAVEAQYEGVGRNLAVVFERKLHHAFRILGFDVQALGQGSGREPDGVATAV